MQELKKNELANKKVKKQTKLILFTKHINHQTLSSTKQKIKKINNNAWKLEWERKDNFTATQTYLDLGFKSISHAKSFFELKLKRQV